MRTSSVCVLAMGCTIAGAAARAQSALHFTLAFGPHPVGFVAVDQYDYSRTFGGPYDDDGRVRSRPIGRPIQTSIWFPATAKTDSPRMRYRDYLELSVQPGSLPSKSPTERRTAGERAAFGFGPSDTARVRREIDAMMHAVRGATPERGPFPVIVYGPSLNAPSFENATLMEYLASYGYIVIASPSVGAQGGQTADAGGLESEARDMEFLIAYAHSLPNADVSRIAAMGFSWGGAANVLVAMRNPRISAVVSLDGSIAYYYRRLVAGMPFVDARRYTVPSLFLKQRSPSPQNLPALGADSAFDFFKAIHYADAYLVSLPPLLHQDFGEWFIRLQQHDGPAFVADTLVQSQGYERIALYARHFLDAYLKGDAEGKAFLDRSAMANGFPASEVVIQRKVGLHPAPMVSMFARELVVQHKSPADSPALLATVRSADPGYELGEGDTNAWGYRLIAEKRFADAIGVFQMNVVMHPKSSNAYDSLGEAYMDHGDRALAIENYQRSLTIDSTNTNAVEMLKKLRGQE